MTTRAELENDDEFVRGYHDLPHENDLRQMSFVQLVSLLATCKKDSPKFTVVEREIKKYLAKDQAKINRSNIFLGVCIGGIFTIVGAIIGAIIKTCPLCDNISPSKAVYEPEKSNLGVKPQVTGISPREPSVGEVHNNPAPVQNDARPSSKP